MLNFFWQKIPAFQGTTRYKPITLHDPDVFRPAATCRSRIEPTIDLGLVDEFTAVSALTERPVKVTMDGPLMLSKVAYEEHCGNLAAMMLDLGRLPNHHFKLLAAVGCRDIQFDQPLFTVTDEAEVDAAIVAINSA